MTINYERWWNGSEERYSTRWGQNIPRWNHPWSLSFLEFLSLSRSIGATQFCINVYCIISSRKFPYLANDVLVCSIFVFIIYELTGQTKGSERRKGELKKRKKKIQLIQTRYSSNCIIVEIFQSSSFVYKSGQTLIVRSVK